MSQKGRIPGGQHVVRSCAQCGAPSDQKSLCSRCSPKRKTQPHRDKYAA